MQNGESTMSMMNINSSTLTKDLGTEVPDIYVVIAKHEILQFDSQQIAETIGVTQDEIHQLQSEELYKNILLILKAAHSASRVDTDLTYDSLEAIALKKLHDHIAHERDPDTLMRLAVMANRATRRQTQQTVLDPMQSAQRVPLTLTSRIVKRLNANGAVEVEETRQLSITDGSAKNPSFNDVDDFLKVSARPMMPKAMQIQTYTPEPDFDDLNSGMIQRGN